MTTRDTVDLALTNLAQAKLRTALTVLGVSIGIASLAGMVSLGLGLQDQFVGRFTKSGMFDSITVMSPIDRPGLMARGFRGTPREGSKGPEKPPPQLDDGALQSFAALAQVKEVYPNLRTPVQLKYGTFAEPYLASGVPMSARGEGIFQTFAYGGFFANDTDNACILAIEVAKRLADGDPKNLIGRQVTLAWATTTPGDSSDGMLQFRQLEAPYVVVGIVERDFGPPMPVANYSGLMIPLAKARALNAVDLSSLQPLRGPARKEYLSATVRVSRAQFTDDVERRIKELGFNAVSLNDAIAGAKRTFIILDIVLSLVGSIALAVSSLGIVNTMVMSILERTREIGIMKAVGGSDGDIRRIFLVEAAVIGGMGGVAGIVLGWAVGRAINFGANIYIQSQGGPAGNLFSLPLWLVASAIAFAFVVSLLAGSYPAARAARLDPIQALRHD